MVVSAVRIAQTLATLMKAGDTRSGRMSEVVPGTIRPLFPRFLQCECAQRVLQAARTLFHLRFSRSWLRPPPRSRPYPPCRPPSRLPLSPWAENRPYIRSRDRFQYVPFADRTL